MGDEFNKVQWLTTHSVLSFYYNNLADDFLFVSYTPLHSEKNVKSIINQYLKINDFYILYVPMYK